MPANTPDLKMIEKVKELRKKNLSFRQISKVLDKDVKTVYTWFEYGVGKKGKLSTLRVGKKSL